MKYNLKKRIGHKDGWMVAYGDGTPSGLSWCDTREQARTWLRRAGCAGMSIVRARSIVVWKKP